MQKIVLAAVAGLMILPLRSFGAVNICLQQLDVQSTAFFQQQAKDRKAFFQANQSLFEKQDAVSHWQMAHKGQNLLGGPPPLTPQESAIINAFVQQQLSAKIAFLQKLNQQRQSCTP